MRSLLIAVCLFGTFRGCFAQGAAPGAGAIAGHVESPYTAAYREAAAAQRNFVVWVSCEPLDVPGAVSCRVERFEGDRTPRVVPAWNDCCGEMWRIGSLSPGASAAQIQAHLETIRTRRQPAAQPTFFAPPAFRSSPSFNVPFRGGGGRFRGGGGC